MSVFRPDSLKKKQELVMREATYTPVIRTKSSSLIETCMLSLSDAYTLQFLCAQMHVLTLTLEFRILVLTLSSRILGRSLRVEFKLKSASKTKLVMDLPDV
jgi:hypothetical protein